MEKVPETLLDINRITTFYGCGCVTLVNDKFIDFFHQFTRILDISGAPIRNLSLAFFDTATYLDFLEWAKCGDVEIVRQHDGYNGEENKFAPAYTMFKIDGYEFEVVGKIFKEPFINIL